MFRLEGSPQTGWLIMAGTIRVPVGAIVSSADGQWKARFDHPFIWDTCALKELMLKLEYANSTYPIAKPEDDDIPF